VTIVQDTPIVSFYSRCAYKIGLLRDRLEKRCSVVDGYMLKEVSGSVRTLVLFMCIIPSAPARSCSLFLVAWHEVLVLNLASTPYLALYLPD